MLLNEGLRSAIGWLYAWKNLILVLTLLACIVIYRPFCKYICPLGAIYSLFNRVSVFRYRVDGEKCIHCASAPEPVRCRSIRRRRPTMQSASGAASAGASAPQTPFRSQPAFIRTRRRRPDHRCHRSAPNA